MVVVLFSLTVSLLLQIEEVWHDHVTTLSCDKSPSTAVNTYFLFDRLLSTLRLQFSNLTREACNYLGNGFNSIASHFLVTTEFLLSEFEIPKIYIDAEMVSERVACTHTHTYTHTHTHTHTLIHVLTVHCINTPDPSVRSAGETCVHCS